MKDIKWFINRLKSMNIPEVAWRIQQKVLQKNEYKKYYTAHLSVTEIQLSKELEDLKPDIERLGINWDNQNYQLFESLDIFGMYDYQIYKKKWNAGFQTNNVWPVIDFSYSIATSQREDIGDIRTNWELNRHFQFVGLAKNYYVTGDNRYFKELKELFEDWNKNNLFLHGVQWTSAMEVAIRVMSWIYMYAFVEKAFGNGEEPADQLFLDKIAHGIKVMANHILRHRARYSSANNHLIVEMLGVGAAGILFGYDEWIDISVKVFTEELPKQNSKDGVNKEMSLHYQSFVMEAYGILWLLMKKNGISVPDSWTIYLSHMSEFIADCCGDYGEVVVFGDNDEGKILDFCGKIEDHYRYVLQLMGILLECRYTDTELIENIYWGVDEKAIQNYQKKDIYIPGLVRSYEEGGYTILRSKNHKVLIGYDHAALGFGSIAAHGHADALSVQVFYAGNPVLVNSGTYNYHVPKKTRNEIRKTAAHNTVYIEDREQAEILGPFLWGKRYKILAYGIERKDLEIVVESEIGYENIKHCRRIVFNYEDRLIVKDRVVGHAEAFQCWNLAVVGHSAKNVDGFDTPHCVLRTNASSVEMRKAVCSNKYNEIHDSERYYLQLKNSEVISELSFK